MHLAHTVPLLLVFFKACIRLSRPGQQKRGPRKCEARLRFFIRISMGLPHSVLLQEAALVGDVQHLRALVNAANVNNTDDEVLPTAPILCQTLDWSLVILYG